MLNNEAPLWDKKYKTSRQYNSIEDVFRFSDRNPSILEIIPYIKDGASVLEIGSGTGELISYLAHKFPKITTFGIDFSAESINHSKEIAKRFDINTEFSQMDIKKMSFNDNSFDIVFGDQVLGHIDDLGVAMDEIYRISKPGGIIAFTIANSMRPDGWYLNKKLSKKHEGYKQQSMFPWTLKGKIEKVGFKSIKYYGDILFLFRNISLIKSHFIPTPTAVNLKEESMGNSNKNNRGYLRKIYRLIDTKFPQFLKVTIGVIAKKN